MKNRQINRGFIISMLLVLAVILSAVFLINKKLRSSIDDLSNNSKPNWRIATCNSIYRELLESENISFAYSLTKDEKYLTQYDKINKSLSQQLEILASKNKNYENDYLIEIFLRKVAQKISNIELLFNLQNRYRVKETLTEVQEKTKDLKPINTIQTEDKKNRFSFSKKTAKEENAKISNEIARRNDQINYLKNEVADMNRVESEKERIDNETELSLITSNLQHSNHLFILLHQLEDKERAKLADQTLVAKKASSEIRVITTVFSIVSILFIVIALYSIFQYFKKNNEHKKLLKKGQEQSERLADARAKFLATMSHEIRTPLNAILGFSDQLHQKDMKDTQSNEQVEIIHNSAKYLSKIINDVLDYSKIELDKMTLTNEVFNLEGEIKEVIAILSNSFAQKGNHFELRLKSIDSIQLDGDAIKFKQILFNLLGNANKFTSNGKIFLEETDSRTDENVFYFSFRISDTGIGMSQSFLKQVFTDFQQEINSFNKSAIGTGLGLSITKKMIDLMQGEIRVESEQNKGTSFYITLPFALSNAAEKQDAATSQWVGSKRVLVIDDEAYNRKLVSTICKNLHCSIDEAENGREALNLVDINTYDIILIDMRMPDISGLELLTLLKQKPIQAQFVALTASILMEEEKANFDRVILKPIDQAKLIECFELSRSASTSMKEIKEEKLSHNSENEKEYDLSELRNFGKNDEAFLQEMLETFVTSSQKGLLEINEALKNNQREEISNTAHKIASPCKHIKAYQTYDLLKKLELHAESLSQAELNLSIAQLNNKFESLIADIQNELS